MLLQRRVLSVIYDVIMTSVYSDTDHSASSSTQILDRYPTLTTAQIILSSLYAAVLEPGQPLLMIHLYN